MSCRVNSQEPLGNAILSVKACNGCVPRRLLACWPHVSTWVLLVHNLRIHCVLDPERASNCEPSHVAILESFFQVGHLAFHLQRKPPAERREGSGHKVRDTSGGGFLTRKRGNIVSIVKYGRVSPGIGIVTFASVKWRSLAQWLVVLCTSQRAAAVLVLMCLVRLLASLLLFVEARQFVLMLPSMLEGVCQHLLHISTGRYVCCTLPCSRDSWVWTPIGWPDQRSINDTLEV